MSNSALIRIYQQRCWAEYSASLELPNNYRYPTGNSIRPVPPIQTARRGLMIIGAYPSARFESRLSPISAKRRLVPVADNLQPFGNEVYFDGIRVRKLESGAGLRQYLLEPLSLRPDECWITDLVKVFLYKPEHADSCADVVPGFKATVLRQSFSNLAKKKRNLKWVEEEYILCEPKVVVTLGEEVARVISGLTLSADELLVPKSFNPEIFGGCKTYFCPHPDACRRSAHWRERMREILQVLREELQSDG